MSEELMKRPTTADAYVRRRAAEIIFPQVWGWLGREHSGCREADVMRDLTEIATSHGNGFEYAKALDKCGWDPDEWLTEFLSSNWVQNAIDELTDQWVRCLNIKPQFKIGDLVTTSRYNGEMGTVVKIDEKLAQYGINFPDMSSNSWRRVNFEDRISVLARSEA